MLRFLLLWILGYILYRLIFNPPKWSFLSSSGKRLNKKKPRHPEAEEMVPCALCGTFVSQREAESKGGRFYCRPKCR